MSEDHTEKTVMPDIARHLLDTVPVSPLSFRIIDYNQPEWLAEFNRRGERIAELEKEKSELLAKCEKYECEIGLAKQQIAALESKSNMYIDLSVAMASTARKVDGLEKERDRLREALKEIAEFADSECGKRIPAPSCVEFLTINRYAEKALKGTGECRK